MCLLLFDRAAESRDRDCYSLTKISEILGGRQRFGMCQRIDHFECGGPVQTGRYSTGESLPIKAGHMELLPHSLGVYMYAIQHISKEEKKTINVA